MKKDSDAWFDDSLSRSSIHRTNYYSRRRLVPSFFSLFGGMSITGMLIMINIVFFLAGILLLSANPDFIKYIAIQPENFLNKGYVWTLLTSMFMHAPGVIPFLSLHLFINMFVLFSLGGLCEKIIGRKRFLWFYLLSGIISGLMFVILAYLFGSSGIGERIFGSQLSYAVGASGAIFAIAGLFVMLTPKLKFYIIFLPFFSLPAYIMVPLVLFVTWLASSATGFPIGNTAHFGGFLAGIFYGLYLRNKYKRKVGMISQIFSQ